MDQDDLLQKLSGLLQCLQDEVKHWTKWANQQITEAAFQRSIDIEVIKRLSQMKDEEIVQERVSDVNISALESSIQIAKRQIRKATANMVVLQLEGTQLSNKMEYVRAQLSDAKTKFQNALNIEEKATKNVQEMEVRKSLLQEEYDFYKKNMVELEEELVAEEVLLKQIEARWVEERNTKQKIVSEAARIRSQTEAMEESSEKELEISRKVMEEERKKYVQNIARLEEEKSVLKSGDLSSRIPSLRRGFIAGETFSGRQHLWREKKCVMCLSQESSVLLLPCKHTILCLDCNELLLGEDMVVCPSCRTHVQRRIKVRYGR